MRKLLIAFLAITVTLALAQLYQLRNSVPPPDGIVYFEVADQMQRVSYGSAMPIHWSPLYPAYILAGRMIFGGSLERELSRTAAGDALLLVLLCVTAAAAFRSVGRLCWPDNDGAWQAWLSYACGLSLFCAFGLLRVGLRLPDALVTSLVIATLWAWCLGIARRLDLRWCAVAGMLSGAAFLARANLLHWSLVAGAVACLAAPGVRLRRRVLAYTVFSLGLALLFIPQTYALSSARGHFTFGETGKIIFAESYGAEYQAGFPAWPVRVNGGDVRVFTEDRNLNFPGFYEVGREFDDASVFTHWWKVPWAIVRSADACLFGSWSSSFALLWPLLWALWPVGLFGIWSATGARLTDPRAVTRRRLSWFLMLAGSAGGVMHLLSFCHGYYMPPYLIALLTGMCLRVLDHQDGAMYRQRAVWLVAVGFTLVAVLTTARHFRTADTRARAADLRDAQDLAAALTPFTGPGPGLRKIAVAGNWLGLYGVRLSSSQVIAEIPAVGILHDRARREAAILALQERGVVALLVRRSDLRPDDRLTPAALTRQWAIVDLRDAQGSGGRP